MRQSHDAATRRVLPPISRRTAPPTSRDPDERARHHPQPAPARPDSAPGQPRGAWLPFGLGEDITLHPPTEDQYRAEYTERDTQWQGYPLLAEQQAQAPGAKLIASPASILVFAGQP